MTSGLIFLEHQCLLILLLNEQMSQLLYLNLNYSLNTSIQKCLLQESIEHHKTTPFTAINQRKRRGTSDTALTDMIQPFKPALMLHLLSAEQEWRKNEQDSDQGGDKCTMTSFFLGGCWCLKVLSGYDMYGSKMALIDKDVQPWYLIAIKNKAPNHVNLIESLLGINYMVNGTLKAIRDNWTWKAYIFHLYWCGDAGIKKP